MPKQKIVLFALLHAIAAAAYVALVAFLMTNAERWFGPAQGLLGITAFLLTFVLSAAVMGIIIFGRPVMWYLNGQKNDAMRLLVFTVIFFFLITFAVFVALAML